VDANDSERFSELVPKPATKARSTSPLMAAMRSWSRRLMRIAGSMAIEPAQASLYREFEIELTRSPLPVREFA